MCDFSKKKKIAVPAFHRQIFSKSLQAKKK
jgi:hypothetical protein